MKGETSDDVQSPEGGEVVLLVEERKEKFSSNMMPSDVKQVRLFEVQVCEVWDVQGTLTISVWKRNAKSGESTVDDLEWRAWEMEDYISASEHSHGCGKGKA